MKNLIKYLLLFVTFNVFGQAQPWTLKTSTKTTTLLGITQKPNHKLAEFVDSLAGVGATFRLYTKNIYLSSIGATDDGTPTGRYVWLDSDNKLRFSSVSPSGGGGGSTNVVIGSLSALRALPDSSVTLSKLYWSTDVGQEGLWVHDPTGGALTDNTGLIIKTATAKCLKRVIVGDKIDAKWFGAKGDNVTNDLVALQLALNNIGNYELHVTAGTYLVNNTWSINNNIKLVIEKGATIKVIDNAVSTVRILREAVANLNIEISGEGVLDGNKANIPSITNTMGFQANISSTTGSIKISGITVKNTKGAAGYGINIGDNDNVYINRVNILDTDYTGIYCDATTRNVSNINITNCYVDRLSLGLTANEGGIKVRSSSTSYGINGALIESNTVKMAIGTFSTAAAIPIEVFRNVSYAKVIGNHTFGGVIGISFAQCKFATATGNTVFSPKDYCYELSSCQKSTIGNNTGNGDGVTSVGVSMNSGSTLCSVTGNTLDSMLVSSIQVNACSTSTIGSNAINARAGYAIELLNSHIMIISNNILIGNNLAQKAIMMNTSGTAVITNNNSSGFTQNNGALLYATTAFVFDNIVCVGNVQPNSANPAIYTQLSGGASLGPNIKVSTNTNIQDYLSLSDSVSVRQGSGNPEGVVFAKNGSLFLRNDGPDGVNTVYVKNSPVNTHSNTGWSALGSGGGGTLVTDSTISNAGGFYHTQLPKKTILAGDPSTYIITQNDCGSELNVQRTSITTIQFPPNLRPNCDVAVRKDSTGNVRLVAISGATMETTGSDTIVTQNAIAVVQRITSSKWGASGNLGTAVGGSGGSGITPMIPNRAVISDASGLPRHSSLVDSTELNYSDKLKANIQDQLNNKQSLNETVMYNKSFWTGTSDFIISGFTPTISSNFIRFTGGAGLTNYGQRIIVSGTTTTDENQFFEVTFRVSGSVTSGTGITIGELTVNSWHTPSVGVQIDCFANILNFVQVSSGTTIASVALNTFTIATNDIIRLSYVQKANKFFGTIVNETTLQRQIIEVTANLGATKNFNPPNTSALTIWNHGGQIDILKIQASSSAIRRPHILCLGDSKTFGFSSNNKGLRWADLITSLGTVSVFAGDGDRTVEMAMTIGNTISKSTPVYAILCIGRNDLASSVATGTWQTNYQNIVTALQNAGITVIHLLPIPETVQSQTALTTFINTTYPSGLKIDVSGGWVSGTMLSSDNIHPNEYGDRYIASQIIASGLIPTSITNYQENALDLTQPPLPDASATRRGAVNTTTQTFAGDKTFTGLTTISAASPELSITSTGDTRNARLQRSSTANTFTLKNKVLQTGGTGNALRFASTTSLMTFANTGFNLTGSFSVSFWFKSTVATGGLLYQIGTDASATRMTIYVLGGQIGVANGVGQGTQGGVISLNTWYNVVLAYNGTQAILYLNNNQVGSTTTMTYNPNSTPVVIGQTTPNGLVVDQLVLWNRTITRTSGPGSSDEVAAIYNSGGGTATLGTTNMVRLFNFDEGTGTTPMDSNPNIAQISATLTNSFTWMGLGNGITPLGSANTEGTFITLTDGVNANERGQAFIGDVYSGTVLQGYSTKMFINSTLYPFILGTDGRILINPSNTSTSATAAGTNALQVIGQANVSGNLGIGTATPQTRLHVAGGLRIDSLNAAQSGVAGDGPVIVGPNGLLKRIANGTGVLANNGSGGLSWTSVMTNPITTTGDMVYGVGTTPTRLGIGTNTYFMQVQSGVPTWQRHLISGEPSVKFGNDIFNNYIEAAGGSGTNPAMIMKSIDGSYSSTIQGVVQSGISSSVQFNALGPTSGSNRSFSMFYGQKPEWGGTVMRYAADYSADVTTDRDIPDRGYNDSRYSNKIEGSASLTYAALAAMTTEDQTITVTGAVVGDIVAIGVPNWDTTDVWTARVTAANTVTIRRANIDAVATAAGFTGTFKVQILK